MVCGAIYKTEFRSAFLALDQTGPWAGKKLFVDDAWCRRELSAKIESMDFSKLREDVTRFLKPVEVASLNIWTQEFFVESVAKLFA